jgi:hypothetical protein
MHTRPSVNAAALVVALICRFFVQGKIACPEWKRRTASIAAGCGSRRLAVLTLL